MKAATIPVLCVLATSICIVIFSQPATSQSEQNAISDKKLNSLLAERRDTLRQIVNLVEKGHSEGSESLDNVIRARNELLDAELDIAKTNAERVRIREEQVKNFRDLENVLTQLYKNGETTNIELLEVKAVRLEAEIELLRE